MWKQTNVISAAFVIAMLAHCWPVPEAVEAQTKANVPKPQNTLVLGEGAVQQLLLLVEPDKNGKISKQAWMRFMAEEFDRLDRDKKGQLDAQELRRSHMPMKHAPAQDVGK
jgi:EF hand